MGLAVERSPVIIDTANNDAVLRMFRGFMEANAILKRVDEPVTNVSSGTNSNVVLTVSGDLTAEIEVGDFVSWFDMSEFYDNGSYRVVEVVFNTPNTNIRIDVQFQGDPTADGSLNYKKGYFVEYQFLKDTTSPENVFWFSFEQKSQTSINGEVKIDVNQMREFLSVSKFDERILYVTYFLRFRESWNGNRDQSWQALDNNPLMATIHSTNESRNDKYYYTYDEIINDGTNPQGRWTRELGVWYEILNDYDITGVQNFQITSEFYDITKSFLSNGSIQLRSLKLGVLVDLVPSSDIPGNAIFAALKIEESASIVEGGDYSGDDYSGDDYSLT